MRNGTSAGTGAAGAAGRGDRDGALSTAWLTRFHPSPQAPVRLACFPHAGGSAPYYRPLSGLLAPSVEVLAVQYPGRLERYTEPLIDDVAQLADLAAEALLPWTDRPLALFGHSLGASVAFETARRLERAGVQPRALVVSARRGPEVPHGERVHTATEAELVAYVRGLGGSGLEALDDPDLRELVLPAIRNDFRASETYTYRPGPDVSCPLLALAGADDHAATPEKVAAWTGHTSGPARVKVLPGGHFYLDGHRETVAAEIRGLLAGTATTG
ncbi:alpha/beta fold hydrolase [Streptomyces sp. NPDC089919]|uniref:thioesterase II family protein n=1 Tax=Streptomyces sp. NPDC089919 TaxID=3155188 RepID=UPI00342DFBEB